MTFSFLVGMLFVLVKSNKRRLEKKKQKKGVSKTFWGRRRGLYPPNLPPDTPLIDPIINGPVERETEKEKKEIYQYSLVYGIAITVTTDDKMTGTF